MIPSLKYTIDPGCPIQNPIKEPAYEGDVGYDLGVAIDDEVIVLEPHGFKDIPTYVRVELPPGVWGDIRPRSSTYARRRLVVMPGTIDNGFRGLLSVFIYNPSPTKVEVFRGDYLAQLVLCPIIAPPLFRTQSISPTTRGEKGFGSSGGYSTQIDSGWSHKKG
jgi:dUTP pyrophosphatase